MNLDKRTTENIIDILMAALPVLIVLGFMTCLVVATIQGR